ncbi:hypothetical protein Sjap_020901 [Stephania japonica]|uniref:DUF4378 domain-containing protein n=1 Tax=Stephania japonica TaxID=461633 RepID=A0AAP0HZE0_9MAGN
MAKRSQKQRARHEKGHPGCMWGLISIFDFRQGRPTQRLLSDRKHGSTRHAAGAKLSRGRNKLSVDFDEEASTNDNGDDESEMLKIDNAKRSVKKLMEDEMSSEQQTQKQIPGVTAKQSDFESEHGGQFGKNQEKMKTNALESNASESLKCQELESFPKSLEQISHLDLVALMEEFCSQIHQRREMHLHNQHDDENSCAACPTSHSRKHSQLHEIDKQLVQKHCILQEKLSEAAAAFLNQKLVDANQISSDGALKQSKQLMDALEILNLNKDLLFELLEDSNSLLVKHIEDLRDSQTEKVKPNKSLGAANLLQEDTNASRQTKELVSSKQVEKQNTYNFFRRKTKPESRNLSKESGAVQGSNRIVILKPGSADINSSSSLKAHGNEQGQSGRFNSQFSISEIKKKLKHAMRENRKERNWISMDGILHKIPHKHRESGNNSKEIVQEMARHDLSSKAHIHNERTIKAYPNSKKEKKTGKPIDCDQPVNHEVASTSGDGSMVTQTGRYSLDKELSIYIEARKHLAEMLSNGNEHGAFSNREDLRSLGRILSLPEYNLPPVHSPGKNTNKNFTEKVRFSHSKNFNREGEKLSQPPEDNNACDSSPLRQNLQIPPENIDGNKAEITPKDPDTCKAELADFELDTSREDFPDSTSKESLHPLKGNLNSEGEMEVAEINEAIGLEGNSLSEPYETNITEVTSSGSPKESPKCLRPDLSAEDETLQISLDYFSSSPSTVQKVGVMESNNDGQERPSPVSVLEPLFQEEIISPKSTGSPSVYLPIQPLRIPFENESFTPAVPSLDQHIYSSCFGEDENPVFEYVTAVLETSDINWDEFLKKYHTSDHPLEPSLFDEVEIFFDQYCGDRKLLFDCINEILMEMHEHHFGCAPFVAFVTSGICPLPEGRNIIFDVWENLSWHLPPHCLRQTLEQIVGRDMEKSRTWLDLRVETEAIGTEMAEMILEELMEDITNSAVEFGV